MNDFYQGVVAAIGMLGGVCAFNYWMFSMMEKRLEDKFDTKLDEFGANLERIALELREERKARDNLYNFVLNTIKK